MRLQPGHDGCLQRWRAHGRHQAKLLHRGQVQRPPQPCGENASVGRHGRHGSARSMCLDAVSLRASLKARLPCIQARSPKCRGPTCHTTRTGHMHRQEWHCHQCGVAKLKDLSGACNHDLLGWTGLERIFHHCQKTEGDFPSLSKNVVRAGARFSLPFPLGRWSWMQDDGDFCFLVLALWPASRTRDTRGNPECRMMMKFITISARKMMMLVTISARDQKSKGRRMTQAH